MTAAPTAAPAIREIWAGPIVDADVHVAASLEALRPYLDATWLEFIDERGFGLVGEPVGREWTYPATAPGTTRPEWAPGDGRQPASDLSLLRAHVLDALDVEAAVANCYFALGSVRHPDFAPALASALNDWLIAEWLDKDSRLRASLVVPPRDPDAMAREIERVGGHPGFVQVLMPVRSDRLYGNRAWHGALQAMARHGLVCGLHFGGTSEGAPTSTGYPSYYLAEYVGEIGLYWAQITSLIAEGVFRVVPDLRVAVLEGGFSWLPSFWWRLDKEWKSLRRDIPWVERPPSQIIREHFRFSVAPLEADEPAELARVLEWLGGSELLMFATDYPHRHDDDLGGLLSLLDHDARVSLMAGTARALYGL